MEVNRDKHEQNKPYYVNAKLSLYIEMYSTMFILIYQPSCKVVWRESNSILVFRQHRWRLEVRYIRCDFIELCVGKSCLKLQLIYVYLFASHLHIHRLNLADEFNQKGSLHFIFQCLLHFSYGQQYNVIRCMQMLQKFIAILMQMLLYFPFLNVVC